MSFFAKKPRYTDQKLVTLGDVQDRIAAFNVLFELSPNGSVNSCTDPNKKAGWRFSVREGVINVHGTPMELDFMEKLAGGKQQYTAGTDVYIKTNIDQDLNIVAQVDSTGNAPAADTTFVMHRSMYAGGGKFSNVSKGGSVYIYDDRQWCYVFDVDRTVDYAHVVTLRPYSKDYTVNVKGGVKMMFSTVRVVDGNTCALPVNTWFTNGYINKVQPFRVRDDWKVEAELLKPYQDILQFGIIFDSEGREVDAWDWQARIKMRENMKWRKNLDFFIGQPIDNPSMIGTAVNNKYAGFMGYLPTVEFAGGVVYDYDPTQGYDYDADFAALIARQDAIKQTTEFFAWDGKLFRLAMERRMNDSIKNSSGSCTFQTFDRMGDFQSADIVKMGVKSFSYAGYSVHHKNLAAMSDTRGIGNGDFPYMCMFMPGDGVKDSKGNDVPAIEVYNPGGATESGTYEEYERDNRKIDGCEYVSGHATETYMVAINAPEKHILIRPQRACA